MELINDSAAKANFSRITREVIARKQPVTVRTPTGIVQIVPYDLPSEIAPAPKGSIRMTKREIELANSLGDSL
ncbi:hypothetical protein [Nibricoccus sp. IMCC34717]|uniref:hypothetical protein n=1 Tax=Nibricoccus sp. IMCC34717 TaxID=3034021 RepID=UPI003850186D